MTQQKCKVQVNLKNPSASHPFRQNATCAFDAHQAFSIIHFRFPDHLPDLGPSPSASGALNVTDAFGACLQYHDFVVRGGGGGGGGGPDGHFDSVVYCAGVELSDSAEADHSLVRGVCEVDSVVDGQVRNLPTFRKIFLEFANGYFFLLVSITLPFEMSDLLN